MGNVIQPLRALVDGSTEFESLDVLLQEPFTFGVLDVPVVYAMGDLLREKNDHREGKSGSQDTRVEAYVFLTYCFHQMKDMVEQEAEALAVPKKILKLSAGLAERLEQDLQGDPFCPLIWLYAPPQHKIHNWGADITNSRELIGAYMAYISGVGDGANDVVVEKLSALAASKKSRDIKGCYEQTLEMLRVAQKARDDLRGAPSNGANIHYGNALRMIDIKLRLAFKK